MLPVRQRRWRGHRLWVPVIAFVLITAPAAVLAAHQFPDVPNTHPFHGDIEALAVTGITAGFSDGTYRPSDPVTRQSMAAFMHRGFGHVALATGDAPWSSVVWGGVEGPGDPVIVRQLELNVPGVENSFEPQQYVYLQGRVTLNADMSSAVGCPCGFKVFIKDVYGSGFDPPFEQEQTFLAEFSGFHSIDVEALFLSPVGIRTYQLLVQVTNWNTGISALPPGFPITSYSSLSAMTFPFGG